MNWRGRRAPLAAVILCLQVGAAVAGLVEPEVAQEYAAGKAKFDRAPQLAAEAAAASGASAERSSAARLLEYDPRDHFLKRLGKRALSPIAGPFVGGIRRGMLSVTDPDETGTNWNVASAVARFFHAAFSLSTYVTAVEVFVAAAVGAYRGFAGVFTGGLPQGFTTRAYWADWVKHHERPA